MTPKYMILLFIVWLVAVFFVITVPIPAPTAIEPNQTEIMATAMRKHLSRRIADAQMCDVELLLLQTQIDIHLRNIKNLKIANESLKDIIRGNPKLKRLLNEG